MAKQEAVAHGPAVAVKIVHEGGQIIQYGRHFDFNSDLYAHVTRASIDILKESFRDVMTKPDWQTVITLKKKLGVE